MQTCEMRASKRKFQVQKQPLENVYTSFHRVYPSEGAESQQIVYKRVFTIIQCVKLHSQFWI